MKANLLLVTGFALLSAGWVQASVVTNPGHFTVDLNDVTGTDGGGWGAGTLFTDSVNTGDSTDGFLQNICVANEDSQQCSSDPRMVVNGGGASIPFPSSFNADANGGGFFDFQNDGTAPITDILFVTNLVENQTYNCDSDIFRFCGFDVVQGSNGTDKLEILFTSGTIPVATPEPSEYVFLLAACAGCAVVHQWRSRRA